MNVVDYMRIGQAQGQALEFLSRAEDLCDEIKCDKQSKEDMEKIKDLIATAIQYFTL